MLLWVGGPGQAAWPSLPNQRLRLTADQARYRAGDTASIFIPNPFGDTPGSAPNLALVTIERGVVMQAEMLVLAGTGINYSLPVTSDFAPNVFVSVTLLGPQGQEPISARDISTCPLSR